MIKFHFCRAYEKKVNGQSYDVIIQSKFFDLSSRNRLTNSGNLHDYSNGLYSLKTHNPLSRIIIQKKKIDTRTIHFVRDIVTNKDLDFSFGKYIHPLLKSGNWLNENPLLDADVNDFEKKNPINLNVSDQIPRLPPPTELSDWLSDYQLDIKYDIFETQDWVKYALSESETEGMRDKDVKSFANLLSKIPNLHVESESFNTTGGTKVNCLVEGNFGILFSLVSVESSDRLILHNGAHIESQKEHWFEAKNKLSKENTSFEHTIDGLSRYAYRAYPKWTIQSDDLWFAIQKNDELSNLSLTQDQLIFFQNFNFPYYINGQAGSGKSTMLYYLFSNAYLYKCTNIIKGEILFLTENQQLLEHTQKAVFDLLSNNPEFDGLDTSHLSNLDRNFRSFKEFLVSLVPNEDKHYFPSLKFLDFSRFRELYGASYISESIKRKYTAEESWFTIITYIYGYNSSKKITAEQYVSEVYVKAKKIPLEKFKGVEKHVLPFYEKLINEGGYWDKLKILRHLQKNNTPLPKYSLVICDEAQDFCRVELRFILKLSEFLNYDLRGLDQIPIVFAGDPNQTVNPTGFREREMTEMLHTELKELAHFDYNKSDSVYNPVYNYRSTQAVVSLANFVQYYRKKKFDIRLVRPQIPKRPESTPQPTPNILFDYSAILKDEELQTGLTELIKYKVFIIPVDGEQKEEYVSKHPILLNVEDADIKTAVEAKGAEYDQVVLYGFGEYYERFFEKSFNEDNQNDDERFRRAYFFNKLYVGITRAKKELIIIDSDSSAQIFWKTIVNNANITDSNWIELNSLRESTIEYNPGTLNGVIPSSREDAFNNANKDKEQGIYDSNSARLKVAANQFYKLGVKEDYFICLAISEEIKGNWKLAAQHYLRSELKNRMLEEAAKCFYKGQHFNDLNNKIGSRLRNINQDVRRVISRLMIGGEWTKTDIEKLSNNRDTVRKLLKDIDWRPLFIEKVVEDSIKIRDIEAKRDLEEIYYVLVNERDTNLWTVIGNLGFELDNYERAIDAWDRVDLVDTKSYVIAKIELSKIQANNIAEASWKSKLIEFESEEASKRDLEDSIINIFETTDNLENAGALFFFAVYSAYLIRQPDSNIETIGKLTEEASGENLDILIANYRTLIEQKRLKQIVKEYVLLRWAKNKQKLAVSMSQFNSEWIEKLNVEYKLLCKNNSITYRKFTMSDVENLPNLPKEIPLFPPNHIRNITVSGFRRFKKITLSNLGLFNLIVGDNNVGKTSILEALLFDHRKDIYFKNLAYAYVDRRNLPRFIEANNLERHYIPNDFITTFLSHNDEIAGIEYTIFEGRASWNYLIKPLPLSDLKKLLSQNSGIDTLEYFGFEANSNLDFIEIPLLLKHISPSSILRHPMVPFGKGFNKDIAQVYSDKIDKIKSVRQEFVKNMEVFIPDIERILVDTESGKILIEESGQDEGHELHQYGEGANKLFRILVQLALQKGGRLLIDEVDAGIHHSRFIDFWKTILQFALINETQVFATTHNLECLKYFDEILRLPDYQSLQEESRVVTLKELPDSQIKSYTRSFEEFDYELRNNIEFRGESIDE